MKLWNLQTKTASERGGTAEVARSFLTAPNNNNNNNNNNDNTNNKTLSEIRVVCLRTFPSLAAGCVAHCPDPTSVSRR